MSFKFELIILFHSELIILSLARIWTRDLPCYPLSYDDLILLGNTDLVGFFTFQWVDWAWFLPQSWAWHSWPELRRNVRPKVENWLQKNSGQSKRWQDPTKWTRQVWDLFQGLHKNWLWNGACEIQRGSEYSDPSGFQMVESYFGCPAAQPFENRTIWKQDTNMFGLNCCELILTHDVI